MSTVESIYLSSPVIIQNTLVSLKGFFLLLERKGGQYHEILQRIDERKNWTEEDFEHYQLNQLKDLLAYAVKNVPYYNRLHEAGLFRCHDVNNIQDILKLPVLDRRVVKERRNEFISHEYRGKDVKLNTTGTTGSPLSIISDRHARQKNYAFFDSFLKMVGLNPYARHVVIGGRIIMKPSQSRPPYWRYSIFQKALLMSAYHISENTVESYIEALHKYDPEYIESYPSAIFLIARLAKTNRFSLNLECLRGIVTSAETLYDYQRELIQNIFGVPVFDQYGNAEMCCMVHQCAYGKYHVRSDYGLLEILDENNEHVMPGQAGSVVCTGFLNYKMPLIRYRIGDMAVWASEQVCRCGLATPILDEIIGREDEVIITPDGKRIGRMSPILKGFPVVEAQYIQESLTYLRVLVVPSVGFYPQRHVQKVVKAVQKRLGDEMQIKVELVDKLVYNKGCKLQNVISRIEEK